MVFLFHIVIGSALALSKIKNCVVNQTTLHSPAWLLKRHSFDTSLHHVAKSSVFSIVNYSHMERAPRKIFHGWIFPHQTENTETDQSGFRWHLTWLVLSFLHRILRASKRNDTLTWVTRSTDVCMCHAMSLMSYDVSDLERFLFSQEVILCFLSLIQIFIFFFSFLTYEILL